MYIKQICYLADVNNANPIPPNPILSHPILSHPILSHLTLSHPILSHLTPWSHGCRSIDPSTDSYTAFRPHAWRSVRSENRSGCCCSKEHWCHTNTQNIWEKEQEEKNKNKVVKKFQEERKDLPLKSWFNYKFNKQHYKQMMGERKAKKTLKEIASQPACQIASQTDICHLEQALRNTHWCTFVFELF